MSRSPRSLQPSFSWVLSLRMRGGAGPGSRMSKRFSRPLRWKAMTLRWPDHTLSCSPMRNDQDGPVVLMIWSSPLPRSPEVGRLSPQTRADSWISPVCCSDLLLETSLSEPCRPRPPICEPQITSGSFPGIRTEIRAFRASVAKPASRVQRGMRRVAASTRYTASYTVRFCANLRARSTRTPLLTMRGPRARRSATLAARCRRVNPLSVRNRFLRALATSSKQRSGVHSSIFDSGSNRGATSPWAGPGARYSTKTLASTTTSASAIPILPYQFHAPARHDPGRPPTRCDSPCDPCAIHK